MCGGCTHAVLGHPSAETINMTAKKLSLNIMLHDEICESCIMGKQRQKNVPKNTEFKAEKAGERVYFDISIIQHKSLGGSKLLKLFVDEYMGFKKSYFLAEKGLEFINFLETNNIIVKTFRCDNAGENDKFKEKLIELGKNIKMEFLAPGSPQQNRIVERAVATMYRRVQATMNYAEFEGGLCKKVWAECAKTATDLDGVLIQDKKINATMRKCLEETRPF